MMLLVGTAKGLARFTMRPPVFSLLVRVINLITAYSQEKPYFVTLACTE